MYDYKYPEQQLFHQLLYSFRKLQLSLRNNKIFTNKNKNTSCIDKPLHIPAAVMFMAAVVEGVVSSEIYIKHLECSIEFLIVGVNQSNIMSIPLHTGYVAMSTGYFSSRKCSTVDAFRP